MKRLVLLGLMMAQLCSAYLYRATVNFSGATASSQTNITLAFSFNDLKLRDAAHGGLIQHLCSRNGGTNNVPCDFRFTDDPNCGAGSTAFQWGFDGNYSPSAGTGNGWLLVPSYTTGGTTPYVCIDDSSVSSYPGGNAGAEFDSNTRLALHFPDGSALNAADYSATGNNGTINGASAATGEIDGGASLDGSTNRIQYSQAIAAGASAFTYECWINPSRVGANAQGNAFFYQGTGSSQEGLALMVYRDSTHLDTLRWSRNGGYLFANNNVITLNAWQHVAFVYSSGTGTFYVNGVAAGSGSGTNSIPSTGAAIGFWYNSADASRYFQGGLDECRYSSTARSADWISTEYANQNAPAAVGAFLALSVWVPPAIY